MVTIKSYVAMHAGYHSTKHPECITESPPKCHHSTLHVDQIIIPHVPDVGRHYVAIWDVISRCLYLSLYNNVFVLVKSLSNISVLFGYSHSVLLTWFCLASESTAALIYSKFDTSSHYYLYSAFNDANCVKAALHQLDIKLGGFISVLQYLDGK